MIKSDCLKIQATNTISKTFENNQIIPQEIKLIKWTNKDFSDCNNNIDKIINAPEFIEAYISLIFVNVEPFKNFI